MKTRAWLVGLVTGAVALGALSGCKKKEEAAATAAPAPEPAPPPPAAPAPAPDPAAAENPAPAGGEDLGDIKRYPGETPLSGTVRVKVPFNAYEEADLNSEKLGGIPAGTLIDLVASYSNWMLVKFPVGVGELGPGWIQLPNIYDARVQAEKDPPPRPKMTIRKPVRKSNKKDDKKK